MNDFEKNMIRQTAIELPDGGDTHVHAWNNGRVFTVTTRVPGVEDAFHENFRFNQLNHAPADSSGLRFLK